MKLYNPNSVNKLDRLIKERNKAIYLLKKFVAIIDSAPDEIYVGIGINLVHETKQFLEPLNKRPK